MRIERKVLSYMRPYKRQLLLGGMNSIFVAIAAAAPAYLMLKIIDDVLKQKDTRMLAMVSAGVIAIMIVKGFCYYYQNTLLAYAGQKVIFDIRNDLYGHIQHLKFEFFEKNHSGQIMSKVVNDVTTLQNVFQSALNIITDILTVITLTGWVLYLDYKLTILVLIIIPLLSVVISRFSGKMRKIGATVQESVGNINIVLQETISGFRIVKSFTSEENEYNRFKQRNHESFSANMTATKNMARILPIIELLNTLGLATVLWVGGYEVINGKLTSGELISFLSALGMLFAPMKRLTHINGFIQQSMGAALRILEILNEPLEETGKDLPDLPEIKGEVKFNNLSFSYNDSGNEVLQNISFETSPGEVVALVGSSGAGKTTLINLLPRFYTPVSGSITIDGNDISLYNLKSIRRQIGIVPQDTILFSGTVADNIAYGSCNADKEIIIQASKAANCHDFIMALDKGYDTFVGEKGLILSGGQKQRIAIARAIVKDPAILLLDEATSALDNESEKLVQEAMETLKKDRTTMIIAHRLTTIQNADRILVMDNGKIAESGKHEELMKLKGFYYRLYMLQRQSDS